MTEGKWDLESLFTRTNSHPLHFKIQTLCQASCKSDHEGIEMKWFFFVLLFFWMTT